MGGDDQGSQIPRGPLTLKVDLRVYSLTAVKRACYRLAESCPTKIEVYDESTAHVTCVPTSTDFESSQFEAAFYREVTDEDLRESIAKETEGVRNLILAHALSRVPLIDAELDQADYREDESLTKEKVDDRCSRSDSE